MVYKLKVQTKNHQNRMSVYNFIKQKHLTSNRGIKFRIYQKDVEIFTNLVLKKDHSKCRKWRNYFKKAKNWQNMRNIGQLATWNALLSSQKHCGINFRWFHIHAASKKFTSLKTKLRYEKFGPNRQKHG